MIKILSPTLKAGSGSRIILNWSPIRVGELIMTRPAGFSIGVPMTGHGLGAVMSFVARTEKLNPVAFVKEKVRLPPFTETPPNIDEGTAASV